MSGRNDQAGPGFRPLVQFFSSHLMKIQSFFLTLISVLFITAACNANSPTPGPMGTPTPAKADSSNVSSGMGTFFSIDEVGLGPNGYVALTNFTDQPASLGGLSLCQGSQCSGLPDVVVDPGKTVRITVGDGMGLEDVVATRATLGELRSSDGEIGLYSFQDVSNRGQILAYLEWGSTPHDNTEAAIQAGLWIEGSYAPSSEKATRLFRTEGGLWLFEE